jgi:hydrazine synthase alpha subunit-like protein/WD40 repeat protein
MRSNRLLRCILPVLVVAAGSARAIAEAPAAPSTEPPPAEQELLQILDAPLLFVKRNSYTGIHIYDTYYKWPAVGGGIYLLENPAAARADWKIRPLIDPTTANTLGVGLYSDPELSWDARKVLFCFKGEAAGSTSIYQIDIDGRNLRQLTDPTPSCISYKGAHAGQHDVAPAYLPDGRITFLSTRPSGLVPCANSGVAILHVMNGDGSDLHPTSANNVNEFDPSVLADGRVLYGRWEYVDKNALTIQSLWTVHPDGTQETALYANNMVFPEAILDARPVPGSRLIVGTLAKHNHEPRGSIAWIDPRRGKNNPQAITNLEHPEDPTFDLGNSCEPWPLSEDVVLFSGRPPESAHNIIEMLDRSGRRIEVLSDPEICLHSPMLVKPRPRPPVIPETTDRQATTGRFFLQDIYQGMPGVKRGEVKWLRVIEETSRISARTGGANPYNQTFLVSSALAFGAKNILGITAVDKNGSAHFEVPAGKAVYFQALDADGRLVQSMRSFVQAAPGTTRSCIGCHMENNSIALAALPAELPATAAAKLRPESWGSGLFDYPSRVQPVLDKHCSRCHGGAEGIAAGIDLSGGWTEHFNISYENLTNRRETQLTAYWIAGIDCMNGTALWSAQLFPPRSHGSGAAPLAELLVSGHENRIAQMTRVERDLLMAWIDTNGLYYGTWDTTRHGHTLAEWNQIKEALIAQMRSADCLRCHGDGEQIAYFENDWINLKDPEFSRILRAPLPADSARFGLGLCRQRKVDPRRQRIHLLWQGYAHAVQPPQAFPRRPLLAADPESPPVTSFLATTDSNYQAMLAIIRAGREKALAAPRVDMPGANVIAGSCRHLLPPQAPATAPLLRATCAQAGIVELAWEPSAETVGLGAELHRWNTSNFTPSDDTLLRRTALCRCSDQQAPAGRQYYALVLVSDHARSKPSYAAVNVPPPVPTDLSAIPPAGSIRLEGHASGHGPTWPSSP